MADVSYKPTFHHNAWRDRLDRVEAAGLNGFNVRFTAIESDLHQVSTVVRQIGTEIDRINANATAPRRQHRLAFTPTLQAIPPARKWGLGSGQTGPVISDHDHPEGTGLMNLDLPHGAQLTSLLVTYTAGAGPTQVSFSLFSTPLHPTTPPATTTLVDLEKSHDDGGIFHLSRDVAPAAAQVDLDSFRYFIVAKATVASFFSLQTFELTYFA